MKGNGMQGPFTGKLGNVVGCRWKDTYYIRTRPFTVKHPNTPAQMAQRMRFTKTHDFLKPLTEILRVGYGAYTANKSAYNAAMSYNMKNALTGNYPDIAIDPALVLLSKGTLPGASKAVVKLIDNREIKFFWDVTEIQTHANDNDKVILILRDLNSWAKDYKMDVARRQEGVASISIKGLGAPGHTIACYMFFIKQKVLLGDYSEDAISNSIYCGTVEIA